MIEKKKHTKKIYVKNTFTVQKGLIKSVVVQNETHLPQFLVLIFKEPICVNSKKYN